MVAAQPFSSVMLVIGPNLGRTFFSLLKPLILAASTKFVTKVGKGMCLFLVVDFQNSLITHHITKA